MFEFNTYVPAAEIWPTAKSHEDKGSRPGLVRGYNIEVTTADGNTDWLSCEYIYEDPNKFFNDEFHLWYYTEHGWTPTGRICFRGYGIESYDWEERDSYIKPCDEDGNVCKEE